MKTLPRWKDAQTFYEWSQSAGLAKTNPWSTLPFHLKEYWTKRYKERLLSEEREPIPYEKPSYLGDVDHDQRGW
jgi:hypothetical protein